MGEISSYPEGYKENAGIFCHNNPWVIIGETVAGRGNDAWNHYTKILPSYVEEKMERQRTGTMIVLSSVAGDRGRQSNFIYGSAKAGLTAYLSGLRNYLFAKKVHVLTVKPGFMDTKMTEGLPLNPKLTATPKQAAEGIYKAFKKQKNVAYVLPIWAIIMLIIRNIPEFIFKKLKL